MRAAIIDTPGKIRVGTISDPTPKPDELVIQVGACGICGTVLHIADGDSPLVRYPVVPGHELAGEAVAVGSNVPQRIGAGGEGKQQRGGPGRRTWNQSTLVLEGFLVGQRRPLPQYVCGW